jgi:hypothetical protein
MPDVTRRRYFSKLLLFLVNNLVVEYKFKEATQALHCGYDRDVHILQCTLR